MILAWLHECPCINAILFLVAFGIAVSVELITIQGHIGRAPIRAAMISPRSEGCNNQQDKEKSQHGERPDDTNATIVEIHIVRPRLDMNSRPMLTSRGCREGLPEHTRTSFALPITLPLQPKD